MGNAKLNSWMQWILLVGVIATLVLAYGAYDKANNIVIPDAPSAETIAGTILAGIDIPTAAEIAELIDIDTPDTFLSVRDEKKSIGEDLATDELTDRDVREAIADRLNANCDDTDIDRKDITSIDVKDVDATVWGTNGYVDMELKVYFDNYGDEAESARVDIRFNLSDLDRDDDYEDAEAEFATILGNAYSCSTE